MPCCLNRVSGAFDPGDVRVRLTGGVAGGFSSVWLGALRGCRSTRPGAQISVGQSQPGGAAQVGERNCRLPLDRWQQPATAVGKQAELDVVPKCWPVRPPPPIGIRL